MIPAELCDRPQWVLYRQHARKGKLTKVPYQAAHASRRASSTDPDTWATYETALAARERGVADGIGFVFSREDPYAGVDFDACLRDGVLDHHVRSIVLDLDTYTERSPSGTGLHSIARAQVGGGRRTSKTPWGGEFEVYDRERYFTMTGEHFDGTPDGIAERDAQLAALRAELLPDRPAKPVPWGDERSERLDDRELLERAFAASNGPKLQALWQGDTSGYASESEADLALCSILAFWTGPDPQRIDWLFRQSGLMRHKWDREDYAVGTITKALAGRVEFYTPNVPLPVVTDTASALGVASTVIRMDAIPLVGAHEQRGGRVVLERADGTRLAVSSLTTLAKFDALSAELAAQFGHELVVKREDKTATAHRFVAALRRHFGPAHVQAAEERFEGWMVDLALVAGEVPFTAGDAESRLRAWRQLDEADPEAERGAQAFAAKVLLARELDSGDRYLRAGWAQEYVRRCGWRGSVEQAAGMFEAVGLEQPNPRSGGVVRAHWRAGGETLALRFWVIPSRLVEQWRS